MTTAIPPTSAFKTNLGPHPTSTNAQLENIEGGGRGLSNESLETSNPSVEEIYENEREQAKIRNWKESPYAVGLVEPTWSDELSKFRTFSPSSSSSNHAEVAGAIGGPCSDSCNDEADPTCGCLKISAIVCTKLGAKRVGNMAILKESVVTVMEDDDGEDDLDEEDQGASLTGSQSNGKRTRLVSRRKIDIVVGPYWPMLVFITYPLIIGVSLWTAVDALPGKNPLFILFWVMCTGCLCGALFSVGCRDPGILLRKRDPPPPEEASKWRWNDQALTWRPVGAIYDSDCACVVEKFDHTCPWTGTAIGKKNMPAFQIFIFFIFFNLVMDIYLMTNTSNSV